MLLSITDVPSHLRALRKKLVPFCRNLPFGVEVFLYDDRVEVCISPHPTQSLGTVIVPFSLRDNPSDVIHSLKVSLEAYFPKVVHPGSGVTYLWEQVFDRRRIAALRDLRTGEKSLWVSSSYPSKLLLRWSRGSLNSPESLGAEFFAVFFPKKSSLNRSGFPDKPEGSSLEEEKGESGGA